MGATTIKILKLGYKTYEYQVPGIEPGAASTYYTEDRQDAIDTCKVIHGVDTIIRFRHIGHI